MPCPAPVTTQILPSSLRAPAARWSSSAWFGHGDVPQIEVCGTPSRTVRSSRFASAKRHIDRSTNGRRAHALRVGSQGPAAPTPFLTPRAPP
jgi:hypothetical protein